MSRSETRFNHMLHSARAGDRKALGHLLDSFRSYLNLFADRKLGADLKPKCSRSDLVQRTFLDAQGAFDRFTGANTDELRAWLERILLNNLGDVVRQFRQAEKRQIGREVPLADHAPKIDRLIDESSPSKHIAALEESERLQQALRRLPPDYRKVIVLRSLKRRKFEAIAEAMGRSAGAVKKLWSRAILQLKEEMRHHDRP